MLRGMKFDGALGHAENDAACFVLRDGGSAGSRDFQQAACAITAHAGEQNRETFIAEAARDRLKQDRDGRTMTVHRRRMGGNQITVAIDFQMRFLLRKIHRSRHGQFAGCADFDFELALPVEPGDQTLQKSRTDVLHA